LTELENDRPVSLSALRRAIAYATQAGRAAWTDPRLGGCPITADT